MTRSTSRHLRRGAMVVAMLCGGGALTAAPAAAADAAPDTTITSPGMASTTPAPVAVSGGATDDTGVNAVQLAVKDRNTNLWWTGSSWASKLAWLDTNVASPGTRSTSWGYTFAPSGGSGDYFGQARATDTAGQVDPTLATVRFSVGGVRPPQYVKTLANPAFSDLTPVDVAVTADSYYVIDVARYRVVKISRATGQIVAEVGGSRGSTEGELAAARSVAVDSAGNVYIADTPNARITKYDANLNLIRSWGTKGTGAGQFTQVYGLAIGQGKGAAGSLTEILYAVDGAGRISRFTLDGAYIGSFASGTAFNQPRMAEVHPVTHDLWVVNARSREILVFDVNGTLKKRFGSEGTAPGQFKGDPRGIAISPDGTRVFVSDEGNYRVQEFNASTYAYMASFGSRTKGAPDYLVDARGLDVTSDNTLVVTDEWAYSMKEWKTSGTFVRKMFGATAAVGGVNSPRGVATDSTGRIYVSDWWNQRIQRWNADGTSPKAWGFRGTVAEPGSINFAWDVAIQPGTGRVFLANRESHEIEVFTSDGAFVTRWGKRGPDAGKFTFPEGLSFDPRDGTLLVSDSGNGRIERFSLDANGNGTYVTSYGTKGSAVGQLNTPTGVSVAADGTIWVADTRNNRIQKRNPSTGAWTAYTAPVGDSKSFSVPWGVTVAPDGSIWVADSGRGRIIKADTSMNPAFVADGAALGTTPLSYPYEVAFGPGGKVYVTDTFNSRVLVLQN